jgi:23S rRNA-/tRNA-specific pseudouridylate synthase
MLRICDCGQISACQGHSKNAFTKFTRLASTSDCGKSDDTCSALSCEPLTGREHQIRKQACALGHAVLAAVLGDRWWRQKKDLTGGSLLHRDGL